MANNTQPLCTLCKNAEICKYTEQYKTMFGKIKNIKHPLFEYKLTCSKFIDARPNTTILDGGCAGSIR